MSIERLQSAVDEVKDMKPAEIANFLKRRRIVGRPGTVGRCPLALMMHNGWGGQFVVGQKFIMLRSGKSVDKVKTPPNLAAFVRMFDAGKFQDLIQVPPRCMPRPNKGAKSPNTIKLGSTQRNARKRGPNRLHLAKIADRFAK